MTKIYSMLSFKWTRSQYFVLHPLSLALACWLSNARCEILAIFSLGSRLTFASSPNAVCLCFFSNPQSKAFQCAGIHKIHCLLSFCVWVKEFSSNIFVCDAVFLCPCSWYFYVEATRACCFFSLLCCLHCLFPLNKMFICLRIVVP